METAILLVDCPDRPGLVASIAQLIYQNGANILHADQHQDNEAGMFFMRIEWALDGFQLDRASFRREFEPIATRFRMNWRVEYSADRPRVAIFVSRYQHCLIDLLHRHHVGELPCEIVLVVSNHRECQPLTEFYKIPYFHFPVNESNKADVEDGQMSLLAQNQTDLIVLARYMQVLSPRFVAEYPRRIINVHHSFLPAFTGARPYHGAFERGVKLIGATSHYVTNDLDEGPIIEQDVLRVSHRDQVTDLIQKGRDLERTVLSRAVRWHLGHRILFYANKTVIFD